jgi:hypothetical protein
MVHLQLSWAPEAGKDGFRSGRSADRLRRESPSGSGEEWRLSSAAAPPILSRWHLNGDGTLCFFLLTTGWTGRELVSELVYKASGWFLEYQLMNGDPDVDVMTSEGIASSNIFDQRLAALAVTGCLPE